MTASNQNFSMMAGDTKNIIVSVTGAGDLPVDLTNSTVFYGLYSPRKAEIFKTSPEITVQNDKITVPLGNLDTKELKGIYPHECKILDQYGNTSTLFTGVVTIKPSRE